MLASNHRCARYDESFRNAGVQREVVIFFSFLLLLRTFFPALFSCSPPSFPCSTVDSSLPRPYVTSSTCFPVLGRVDNSTCQLAHLRAPCQWRNQSYSFSPVRLFQDTLLAFVTSFEASLKFVLFRPSTIPIADKARRTSV